MNLVPWEANNTGQRLQGEDIMNTSYIFFKIMLDLTFFQELIITLVKLHRNINWYTYLYKEKTQPDSSLLFKMEKESENIVTMIHSFSNGYWPAGVYRALY